jgi:hypothetical protein
LTVRGRKLPKAWSASRLVQPSTYCRGAPLCHGGVRVSSMLSRLSGSGVLRLTGELAQLGAEHPRDERDRRAVGAAYAI